MRPRPVPDLSLACAAVIAAILTGAPGHAAVSAWSEAQNVKVRLVAGAAGAKGANAAIEIELAPGWHTYWRAPGDAGIPPRFDFSRSVNLKGATVAFPPPARFDDGFAVSNVYFGRVALPVTVEPADPAAPVALAVRIELGVCEEVCIPVTVESSVSLVPGQTDAESAALLADAVARLPGAPVAGEFDIVDVRRAGGDDMDPVFEFEAHVPDPATTQVFVEGPPDWYPDVPKPVKTHGKAVTYRVSFDRLGATTPVGEAAIRFTVVSGGRAIEESVALD